MIRVAGQPLALRVVVRNDGDRSWAADVAEDPTDVPDSAHVIAWVLVEESASGPMPAFTGRA